MVKYLIIGNGRLAKNMCAYFSKLALCFAHWVREDGVSVLKAQAALASHVLLAISDQAIAPFILRHPFLRDKICVHFSGGLLSPYAYSAHPLQAFTQVTRALKDYQAICFIIEAEGPAFSQLLPGLANRHYRIPGQKKAYYHSLCVMANNFSTLLWQKFFRELAHELNIPEQAGIPFLKQTFKNLATNYETALTGPLTRGDCQTLLADLKVLQEKKDPYSDVFASFLKAHVR